MSMPVSTARLWASASHGKEKQSGPLRGGKLTWPTSHSRAWPSSSEFILENMGKRSQSIDIEVRHRSSLLKVPERTRQDRDRTEVLAAPSTLAISTLPYDGTLGKCEDHGVARYCVCRIAKI